MAALQYFVVAVLCLGSSSAVHVELSRNIFILDYVINNQSQSIDFSIEARTTGWVAIGFNPVNASMYNADYMMGYVNGNQRVAGDFFVPTGAPQRAPVRDTAQHWIAINGSESGGITRLAVNRSLITGDDQDFPIQNRVIDLLWAYNNSTDNTTIMHTTRGSKRINLFNYAGDTRNGLSAGVTLSVGVATLLLALTTSIMKS